MGAKKESFERMVDKVMKLDTGSMTDSLERARALLEEGQEEQARKLILTCRRQPCGDPDVHFQWGLLCERIEAFQQARESYESAVRLSPCNPEYLYHTGALYYDAGNYEKAQRYLAKVLQRDPDHAEGRRLLSEILTTMGHHGAARVLNGGHKGQQVSPLRYFPQTLGDADLETFLHLFAGRETGYAIQEIDQATGVPRWEYHEGIMSADLVKSHIMGEVSLGGLPLRSDNTARYAAIHARPAQHALFRYLKNPSILLELEEQAQEIACRIASFCSNQGIPAYLEDSGDRGRRVWLFFPRFYHFLLIKRFLTRVLETVTVSDSRLCIEPLAATRPVGIGWQERIIPLPLGMELQTGKRRLFIDSHGEPFPEQLKQMKKIRCIDEVSLRGMLRSQRSQHVLGQGRGKRCDPLAPLWKGCPVLAEIKTRAQSGRKLAVDERLILFYTIGVSHRTRHLIHEVCEPCPDYDYQKYERMLNQLKPHPISCLKIRHLVPEITSSVNCSCVFDLRGGRYPSPFLHLEPETHLCVAEDAGSGASVKELSYKYILLLHKIKEMILEMERFENALVGEMQRKGLSSIKTPSGTLRLAPNGERHKIIVEGF